MTEPRRAEQVALEAWHAALPLHRCPSKAPHGGARCILPAGHDPTLGHMTVSGIADFAHYTWSVTAGEQP